MAVHKAKEARKEAGSRVLGVHTRSDDLYGRSDFCIRNYVHCAGVCARRAVPDGRNPERADWQTHSAERKNRAAAREHFRIADEAAFHLQHNDEYLLPLRAGPENRSAGYARLHELSAQELFGDCEGRHNPVHGGAGTHARVPRRGANQI